MTAHPASTAARLLVSCLEIETMSAPPEAHPLPVNLVRDAAPSPSQLARAVTLLQPATFLP